VELMQATPALSAGVDSNGSSLAAAPKSDAKMSPTSPTAPAIRFQDVSFAYPSQSDRLTLNHLSFSLPRGARYALVGPSGAGKSTLFAMLLRFYQPQSGRIELFGRDVSDWRVDELRQQIGVVTQEPVIFAASAMENIRYGRLDASDEEVRAAAQTAHAHGFISALPEGYASFLGERGVRLSGGQKQRISIARAILKNPPILLLDEATSALDAESEREVQQALESVLPGRTSLTIAHRLATVLSADQILVLDGGKLLEQGTHQELIALARDHADTADSADSDEQGGLYARLAKLQFA